MLDAAKTILTRSMARFARDETGATAIEYAMIASGIAVAIAATVMNLGTTVNNMFTSVSNSLK
jgi:pilus assembly protein Flp/PilA